MMKVALGVRNLVPGGGPGASAPAPPAAPAGAGASEGAMLVTGVAAGGAGMARSTDSFQDMGRVVDSATELENASDLSRAANTADTVDDLARVRLAEDFDEATLVQDLDDLVETRNGRIDALEGVQTNPIEHINRQISDRIGELDDLGAAGNPVDDFTPPTAKLTDVGTSDNVADRLGLLVDASEANRNRGGIRDLEGPMAGCGRGRDGGPTNPARRGDRRPGGAEARVGEQRGSGRLSPPDGR